MASKKESGFNLGFRVDEYVEKEVDEKTTIMEGKAVLEYGANSLKMNEIPFSFKVSRTTVEDSSPDGLESDEGVSAPKQVEEGDGGILESLKDKAAGFKDWLLKIKDGN